MKRVLFILVNFLLGIISFAQEINYSPLYYHNEFDLCNNSAQFELLYNDYYVRGNYYDGNKFILNSDSLFTKCTFNIDKGYKYATFKNYSDSVELSTYWILGNGIIIRNIQSRVGSIQKDVLTNDIKDRRNNFLMGELSSQVQRNIIEHFKWSFISETLSRPHVQHINDFLDSVPPKLNLDFFNKANKVVKTYSAIFC